MKDVVAYLYLCWRIDRILYYLGNLFSSRLCGANKMKKFLNEHGSWIVILILLSLDWFLFLQVFISE